jgi:catechol 2,3-dioxygenase-like lactoylglutathione lyase family enzyme
MTIDHSCSCLKVVTLSTNDLDSIKHFYVEGMQMSLAGPLAITSEAKDEMKNRWEIAGDLDFDLYVLSRPNVEELIDIRLLHFKQKMPAIHNSWSSREKGSFSMGFPNAKQFALDKSLREKGISSMNPMQEGEIPRVDGSNYRYWETIYQAPDFVHIVGIERGDGESQLAPVDAETGMGGPGYSAFATDKSDAELAFYTDTLGLDLRSDRHWETSPGSALGIEAGVPFRFSLVYSKHQNYNHILFLDYEDGVFEECHEHPRLPNRGIGMWSFETNNINDIIVLANKNGHQIASEKRLVKDPVIGNVFVATIITPSNFIVEIFERERLSKGVEGMRAILTGNLDNRDQIEQEQIAGKQIHPYAKHITRDFSHRVLNKPANQRGIYLLEESYYQYPDKPLEIKPLLFFIEPLSENDALLHSIEIPASFAKADFINANHSLYVDYADLVESPRFQPASYRMNADGVSFSINHPNDLGNGLKFTLIETLSMEQLSVMELLEKDGQKLTPYDTPLIYKRITE